MLYTHQSVFIKHLKQKSINTLVYLQLKKKNQIETNMKNNLILIATVWFKTTELHQDLQTELTKHCLLLNITWYTTLAYFLPHQPL